MTMNRKIKPKWIRFTEKTNAFDYLEGAGEYIQEVEVNPESWKWVILGLHGALYGFAICACKGTNDSSVRIVTKKGVAMLISFDKALKRCKDENLMRMTIRSKHLVLSKSQDDSIKMLKREFRNEFEHFQPKAWSIEIHGFYQMAIDVLDVIRFLVLDTGNYVHLSYSEERKLKSIIFQSKQVLTKSPLYKEIQILKNDWESKKK